jgi:hypothetical protein
MGRGRSDKAVVNFNAGEWSPLLEGRIDLEKAGSACRILENMLVETYGSVRRRPGTQFMGTAGLPAFLLHDVAVTVTAFQSRSKTATATMIGYNEFVVSSPPRKYRRWQMSGTGSLHGYLGPVCAGAIQHIHNSLATGWGQYDRDTGALTTGGAFSVDDVVQSTGPFAETTSCINIVTNTATTQSNAPSGVCCTADGGSIRTVSISRASVLSDEDTETDAIARSNALVSWSSWATVSDATTQMRTLYAARTSGFTFGNTAREFTISFSGMYASLGHTVHLDLYRRPSGTGSFTQYGTMSAAIVADGSGHGTVAGEVPQLRGYDVYATFNKVTRP